jgi:hypothetical protein
MLDRPAMPERPGGKRDDRAAVMPARADDPAMRKLRAKFGGGNRELKGGLG